MTKVEAAREFVAQAVKLALQLDKSLLPEVRKMLLEVVCEVSLNDRRSYGDLVSLFENAALATGYKEFGDLGGPPLRSARTKTMDDGMGKSANAGTHYKDFGRSKSTK